MSVVLECFVSMIRKEEMTPVLYAGISQANRRIGEGIRVSGGSRDRCLTSEK